MNGNYLNDRNQHLNKYLVERSTNFQNKQQDSIDDNADFYNTPNLQTLTK